MKPLDPRLLKYAAAARAFLGLGALLALAQTACTIGFAWFLSRILVDAIAGRSLGELGSSVAALAVVVVARSFVLWLIERTGSRGAALVKAQLRGRMLGAITRLGPGWLAKRNATAVATIAGTGLDALDGYFSRYLPQLILTAVATPVVVLVIFAQDWLSALSIVLTLPIIPVFMILIGWATQKVQRRQWQALTRLSQGFVDVIGGLATLKLFGRQHRQAARIQAVTDDYRAQTMTVLRLSFVSGFVLELAASLAVALVAVSIGLRLIDGSLGLSVGLFVLLLAPEAFLPLRGVGTQFHAAADGVAAADDAFAILDEADALPAASVDTVDEAVDGALDGSPRADELALSDVGVRYDGEWAVRGVSARFRSGTVTAVTGASGSGKSSLVAALLGFVPHEGRIELAGAAIGDKRERPWLAWAGQRPGLVGGTILENIALGSAQPSRALAVRALGLAGAAELAGGALGPDRMLGAGGSGLSGGQGQRVAVARAIYRALERNCPVIVLDEPSSALDAGTERELAAGLRELADEGRIVIVVSHRPALIEAADERLELGDSSVISATSAIWPTPGASLTGALS